MKAKLLTFCAVIALVVGVGSTRAAAASVSVFYEALDPYGEWIDTDDYGYIWHPREVEQNWRPYTVGNWAYTDAGWTWVSEEPFGWATYHYGRWVEIEQVGWSWVPDSEWGPAWVSWRRSDRHVGWAPLPPEARFEARVGIHDWSDSYYDIGPASYSFVLARDFGAPRLRTVIVEPRQNITIITETRNITNITYVNNIVVNQGPQYDVIVRESAQPVRRLKLDRRTDVDFRGGGDRKRFNAEVTGDTLRMAAPEIQITRDTKPQKVGRKLDRVAVDRGWKTSGDAKTTERVRAKIASEAKVPADLPPISRLPGSDRKGDGERQPKTATEAVAQPGAPVTAEKPVRGGKPGVREPATVGATTDQPKPGMKESPTAGRETGRTPGTVEAPATEETSRPEKGAPREKPEKGVARQKSAPEEKAPTATTKPDRENERPEATVRQEMPKRPDVREPKKSQPPAESRPENEKPQKRFAPEAEKPARQERPENIDRPERKGPPSSVEDRSPQRQAPKEEQRKPERSRPEASDRSPENRPPAPEARSSDVPKKGGDAPKKGDKAPKGGDKDDKKDN